MLYFCEQSIDYSMNDENLTLQRVETWTVAALKEYVKKRGLPVTVSKKVLADSEILVGRACCNQCFVQKNTKSDSKHSTAIVNKLLFTSFDLSADLTQIWLIDRSYWFSCIYVQELL